MKKEIASLIFYTSLVAAFGLSYEMTKHTPGAGGGTYHGRYTRDIHDPELLIPRRINEDGSFLTFTLPNFYDRQELEARKKRAADADADTNDDLADHKLHLVLPFNSADHHVELIPNHDFISPDLVSETRGDGSFNDGIRFKRIPDLQCHYRGHVRGHDNSRAALSLCEGVAGYVQTNHGRYFIEPLSEAVPDEAGQHLHMVYKREIAPHERSRKHRNCGTGNNWESAWAEQIQRKNLEDRMISNETFSKRKVNSGTHSVHRYLELGLFCDKRFLEYHNGTDYEQYILTIMNMVFDYYHDASVGNQMDVVVVRIVYLEKQEKEIDLLISTDGDKTLGSFAAWQHKQNPPDAKHPNHHDIGVLITRYDICAGTDEPCGVLGIAYTGAACDSPISASINEDSGLELGVVMTHEIGHTLGSGHDEPDVSGCEPGDKDGSQFIMSPYVSIYTYKWSPCSRKFITNFVNSGLGDCLVDNPKKPNEKYKFPEMLPGAMYDGKYQCNIDFPGSTLCSTGEEICERLWCRLKEKKNKRCSSKGPPAEGTKCAENKWCIHHKCVEMGERPAAVNGGWGSWGSMGECSRTCGGGVSFAEKECDNPPPKDGGRYCIGERKKHAICNTAPCDESKPSFRNVQCAEYNSKPILPDGNHTWTAKIGQENTCALYCANEEGMWTKLAPTVQDGTPCKAGTNNMCISSVCRDVGCDWVLDSDVLDDQCGICGGSGTECTPVEGDYTETGKSDYQKIVTVPKGSRNIKVMEKKPAKNTLAIRLDKGNEYILNGAHREEVDGEYPCAGDIAIYSHPEARKEEISIKGPIKEDIQLLYTFYNRTENPGVHWIYFTLLGKSRRCAPEYLWNFLDWGPCSAICGGGTQIIQASCIEHLSGIVSSSFCKDLKRPEPKSRVCNTAPCHASWRVSQWSECSACGGKQGEQRRKVQCVKPAAHSGGEDVEVELSACKDTAPKQTQDCTCSKPCRRRSVSKARRNVFDEDSDAESGNLPSLDEQRNLIDKLVDKGMTRYLEKPNAAHGEGRSVKRNVAPNFKNSIDDRVAPSDDADLEDRNNYPGVAAKNSATSKPGSIVKDVVPPSSIVLMEAPYVPMYSNLSDQAFQEDGETIDMELETGNMKTYTGAEAVKRMHSSGNDEIPNSCSSTKSEE